MIAFSLGNVTPPIILTQIIPSLPLEKWNTNRFDFEGAPATVNLWARTKCFCVACSLKSVWNWHSVDFISRKSANSIRCFVDTLLVISFVFTFLTFFFCYTDTIDWQSDIRLRITNDNKRDQDFTASSDNQWIFLSVPHHAVVYKALRGQGRA